MKDLLLRVRIVVSTSKMKISRRRLADYAKKNCTTKRAARSFIFHHATYQVVDWWWCRCYCRCHVLNSLVSARDKQTGEIHANKLAAMGRIQKNI